MQRGTQVVVFRGLDGQSLAPPHSQQHALVVADQQQHAKAAPPVNGARHALLAFLAFACNVVPCVYALRDSPHVVLMPRVAMATEAAGWDKGALVSLDLRLLVPGVWLVHFAALIGFACVSFLDCVTIAYAPNPLKRNVALLMLPVNGIALLTYALIQLELVPFYVTPANTPVSLVRYVQWSLTSPTLVLSNFVIGGVGWTREATTYMALEWVTIMSGLVASLTIASPATDHIGIVAFMLALLTFVAVVRRNFQLLSPNPDVSDNEQRLWRGLQYVSLVVWCSFPVVWVLQHSQFVSQLLAEGLFVLCDFSAKMIYTVIYASQSFLSIDMQSAFQKLDSDYSTSELNDISGLAARLRTAHHTMKAAAISQLSGAETSQRAFLKCISHEMRTPLNIVIAHNTSLLDSGVVEGEARTRVQESLSMAEAMLCQVDLAIEFSSYERDGIVVRSDPTSLVAVLDAALEVNIHRAIASDLDFRVTYPGETVIETDTYHLQTLITILIDNCVKFAVPWSTVHIAAAVDFAAQCVVLTFHNGRSELIDPSMFSSMFLPFTVCTMRDKEQGFSGIGLGLALVEAKVRALGGVVEVHAHPPDPLVAASAPAIPSPAQALDVVVRLPLSPNDRTKPPSAIAFDPRSGGALPPSLHKFVEPSLAPGGDSRAAIVVARDVREDIATTLFPLVALRVGARLYAEGVVPPEDVVLFAESSTHNALRRSQEMAPWAVSKRKVAVVLGLNTCAPLAPLPNHVPAEANLRSPMSVRGLASEVESAIQRASVRLAEVREQERRRLGGAAAQQQQQPSNAVAPRVLSVDDNAMNLKIVGMILKKMGCDLVTACDGVDAVEKAQRALDDQRPFHLVLMDLRMPRMDGNQATKEIRRLEAPRGIRQYIAALTANNSAEDRREALEAGCDEFLTKPVRQGVIKDTLAKAMRHAQTN